MKSNAFEELYTKLAPEVGATTRDLPLPEVPRKVRQFNVFNVADLMLGYRNRPLMKFDRRAFYKISLIWGRSQLEYADQLVEVAHNALWFVTRRVPYRWLPQDLNQTGYFCVFTDEFLLPASGGMVLQELPIFQPNGHLLLHITDAEYSAVEVIFQKMSLEIASGYAY